MAQRYKCRAECLPDVLLFLAATRWAMQSFDFEPWLYPVNGKLVKWPDYTVCFTARRVLGLQALRWIANRIPDCHVIAESLATADKYDEERVPLKNMRSPPADVLAKVADGLREYREHLESEGDRVESAIEAMATSLRPGRGQWRRQLRSEAMA